MAAYAAHLTRTAQGIPSVFEVVAQEALGSTVKPAIRKVIEYLSSLYGGKLDICLQWYDELFLLLDLCLQRHYLKHYAASFSECFYGLQRASTGDSWEFSAGHRLAPMAERASLLTLTLWPYLRDKLYAAVDKWRENDQHKKMCAYVLTRARAHAPLLSACSLTLVHGEGSGGSGQGVLLRALQYGAFVVQFMRWWHNAHNNHINHITTTNTNINMEADTSVLHRYKNKCPLCLQPWSTPTVLPVSGLIYCYGCIRRSLSRDARCPATQLPADINTLHRLYIN